MYLYYDDLGILREIINDEALRQYNDNVNTIYMYFEGDRTINTLEIFIKKNDGTIVRSGLIDTSNEANYETKQIVYDQDRLLNYFQYGKSYKFYKYTLTESDLDQAGAITITPMCSFVGGNFITGAFTGVVASSEIEPTELINMGEYLTLLNYITELTAKTSVLEINTTENDFGALDSYAVENPNIITTFPESLDFDLIEAHIGIRIKFTLSNSSDTLTLTYNPTLHFSDMKEGTNTFRHTYTGVASNGNKNVVCPIILHFEKVKADSSWRLRFYGLKEIKESLD